MKVTVCIVVLPAFLFLLYLAAFPAAVLLSAMEASSMQCTPVESYAALGAEEGHHRLQKSCVATGALAEQYRSGTVEQCAAQCRAHPMCAHWNFGKATRNCQLLDRSAKVSFMGMPNVVAGSVILPTAEEELAASGLKIDVVYTWINGSHPDIRAARGVYHTDKKQPLEEAMVRDYHVLKYSLRSLEKYMPWVNHVYIVVNQGVAPDWFNFDQEWVSIVPHSEIFPNVEETLPTFNSRAIESALRWVDTEGDCFIYMNDDQLMARPRYPSEFCNLQTGRSNTFLEAHTTGSWDGLFSKWALTLAKTNDYLSRMWRRVESRRFTWHGPVALSKAAFAAVHEGMPERINATFHHRFRDATDVMTPLTNAHTAINEFNSTVVHRAWAKTGLMFEGFVNHIPKNQDTLENMKGDHYASVCLNDHFGKKNIRDDVLDHIERGLNGLFPKPSVAEQL